MPPLDADWSGVTLVNLPGPATWPIALPTMLYLPTDATSLGAAGQLLRALATHLLSDEVQGTLLPTFGGPPPRARLKSQFARGDKHRVAHTRTTTLCLFACVLWCIPV
jgi:hypothetical protein